MELDRCPYAYQPTASLLGQTSSQHQIYDLANLLIFVFFFEVKIQGVHEVSWDVVCGWGCSCVVIVLKH